MKRLWVILPLVMATGLYASPELRLQAPAFVAPGEVVTISMTASEPCCGFDISAIGDGGAGGVVSDITFEPRLATIDPGYIENTSNGVLVSYALAYDSVGWIESGAVLFSFSYQVPVAASGTIAIAPVDHGTEWLSVVDGEWHTAYESYGCLKIQNTPVLFPVTGVTMQAVPEPATLLLLGLGGLLLRRR